MSGYSDLLEDIEHEDELERHVHKSENPLFAEDPISPAIVPSFNTGISSLEALELIEATVVESLRSFTLNLVREYEDEVRESHINNHINVTPDLGLRWEKPNICDSQTFLPQRNGEILRIAHYNLRS